MRFVIFCVFSVLLTSTVVAQESKRKVKIIQIDSTLTYYFIKGKFKSKPKGKFILISKRDSTFTSGNRIEKNKTYNLRLSNYLSEDKIRMLPAKPKGTLLLRVDGYIIWDGKLDFPYKSSNIKSIYYFE